MSTSPIFVATFADKVCTRMSINCTPDELDVERGKTLARYAYESRTGKPVPAFTKAHFEDTNGKVLMSYSAIELNDDADEPVPEPDEPAPSSKKRRSKSKTAESADAKTNAGGGAAVNSGGCTGSQDQRARSSCLRPPYPNAFW